MATAHPKDFTPLTLAYARTWGNPTGVEVVFTAPVAEATATNALNYTISPGVTVTRAVMGTNASSVQLTTTTMPNGVLHTLTVNNVQDRSTPPNIIPANSQAAILKAQGVITHKVFTGMGGGNLSELTNNAKFPDGFDALDYPSLFETPVNVMDNYGVQFQGYVHPPVTGDYTFYIAADDTGVLFLSPDANPANKTAIASVPAATGSRQWTAVTNQQSAFVRLEAGRAYYVEALMKEAGGADNLAVAWRMRGMPGPADGDSPIPGPFLSSTIPSAPVSIVTNPLSQTIIEGSAVTFSVAPTGTPAYTYQWYRNGLAIPGANGSAFSIANVRLSDSRAVFAVVASNSFSGARSADALLTVTPDLVPPTLARLSGSPTLDRVVVSFSKPVSATSALNPAHYTLDGGLTVYGARLLPDQTNVALLTSPQTAGQTYALSVNGVTDTTVSHNAAHASANFTAWVLSRGFVRREAFYGISGSAVSDLVNSGNYPDKPDAGDYMTQTEAPQNIGGSCGERLTGLLTPPVDGYYTFLFYTADQGALFLSTDESPVNKAQLASEPQWNWYRNWVGTDRRNPASPENRSLPVYLQAGQRYYFEALMKDADGDNRLGITWQLPGAAMPNNGDPPILAPYLAGYASPVGVSLSFTQQPLDVTVAETDIASFTVGVAASYSPVFYQWQKNGVDIPGANGPTYTTGRLFRDDDGSFFACVVSIPGAMGMSEAAGLTVIPDNTPPQALSAATLAGSTNVGLRFDKLMDPASVTNPANYTLSILGAVTEVTLRPDGKSVSLVVNALAFTNYFLNIAHVRDYAGNPLAPNTVIPVAVQWLENRDLGWPYDPVEKGSVFTCELGVFEVSAGGGDFWDTSDRGHFVYQTVEGDFDVAVRVETYQGANCYSRAGLMARENLSPGSAMVNATMFPQTCANHYEGHYRGGQDWGVAAWPGGNTYGFPGIGIPLPNAWIRLTRTNNTFTAYAATNGTDWIQFSQFDYAFTNRMYVGMASSAQYNNYGSVEHVTYRDYRGVANPLTPMPDLLIKRAGDGAQTFALDNIYQTIAAGAQILSQWANPTNPASFAILAQNDGNAPQNFLLRSLESSEAGWTVAYHDGGNDITAQITNSSGYTISNLPPGGAEVVLVDFLPNSRVLGSTTRSATVSIFTDANAPAPRDSVQALAMNELIYQPDMQVRRLTDAIYAGEGVFNSDGSNQTKSIRALVGAVAVYPLLLVNTGNLTNYFAIRAGAGGGGWSVRYFDAVTGGGDITGEITDVGTVVSLIPGGSWEFHAEITPDGSVPGGSSNVIFVTATSVANPQRADTVKMVTYTLPPTNTPQSRLYTTDADFEEGTLVGTAYSGDQLTLSSRAVVPPFIWVPNSDVGTVSKVDIRTGREVARYRTCPPGVNGQPSRTTIDQYGNCWVANRQSGTVVKIGLYENGQYVDRNGDGIIQTSWDKNGDGDISDDEVLPWGSDECVLTEVIVIPGKEGTYVPGTYFNGYVDAYWNPGPRGIGVDAQNNVWVGTHDSMTYYYLDGSTGRILQTNDVSALNHTAYGAVIDGNGILWSSGYKESGQCNVLRIDPANNDFSVINIEFHTYGIGLDRNNHVFVSGHQEGKLTRINTLTATRDWTVDAGYRSRGVAVTADGDVWVVCSGEGNVWRYSNNGVFKNKIPVGSEPTGACIDSEGKVWVVNNGDEYIHRIDPANDTIITTKRIIGGHHYGYTDMTGNLSRNTTIRYGTWSVIHDSRVELTPWGRVSWHGYEPNNNSVHVRVRSSADQLFWSDWETATNGGPLGATPPGEFLQVEVALRALAGQDLPILYDLTVEPMPQGTADLAITQTAIPNPATNEHQVAYTLLVTNYGPNDARGVFVTNVLPANVSPVSVTCSQGTVVQPTNIVRCNLGGVAANSSATVTIVAMITAPGMMTNFAGVAHYEKDLTPENNLSVLRTAALANPCAAPPQGVVDWWPGEGSTGDLVGTDTGILANGATFAAGKVGQAFSLNGAGAYVELGRVSPGATWTLEAWINASAILSDRRVILGCHADCRDWSLLLNNGEIGLNIGRNGCVAIVGSGINAVTGVWYHVVGTCDGSTAKLYVNGQLMNSGWVDANYVGSSASLRIGGSVCCGEYFAGLVDEATLYNRALSPAEVFDLFDAGGSGKCKSAFLPSLAIAASTQGGYILNWPANTSGFQLEFTTMLGGNGSRSPSNPW